MFNIGMMEMVVIAGIALMILGPEKFPTQAKIFLRLVRDFRDHWDDAKRDILQELNPVKKELRELQRFRPEEIIDKLTGDEENAKKPESDPYVPVVQSEMPGANEAPVEFGGATNPESQGRSESTTWERKDEPAPLSEEGEYRSAQADYDLRPRDGSD